MKTILQAQGVGVTDTELLFAVRLPSGRSLNFNVAPSRIDPQTVDELPSTMRGVVDVVTQFAHLDRAITAINADARLTTLGRTEKLREPRATAIKVFGRAYNERVLAHAVSTAKMEADFYKLPAFSAENYQRDRHILDLLLSAPKEKNSVLFAHAMSGEDPEFAAALLRAPKIFDVLYSGQVSGRSMRELGEQAWRASVDKREPEKGQMVKLARELNAWGEAAFKTLANEFRAQPGKAGDGVDLFGDEMRADIKLVREGAGHAAALFS